MTLKEKMVVSLYSIGLFYSLYQSRQQNIIFETKLNELRIETQNSIEKIGEIIKEKDLLMSVNSVEVVTSSPTTGILDSIYDPRIIGAVLFVGFIVDCAY